MPDANPDSVPEDLTINDQETIIELILEQGIGIDNAIAEHDETGDESQDFEIEKEFKVCSNSTYSIVFTRPFTVLDNTVSYNNIYMCQYVNDITHPPPQA